MKIIKKAVSFLLTLTMVLTIFTVVPVTVSAASQSVTYVDENGETQTVTATILTGAETELSPGWYAVTEDIRYEDAVNLSAPDSEKDINIILCDSATMLLTNEVQGFYSEDSVSLNIYGQSNRSGALKSQGGDFIFLMDPNASLNIFGGELTSSYLNADYCTVTCAGDINISGGSVEKCELVSYNNLTVSGGSVNVPYLMADQTVRFEGGAVNVSNDGIYAGSIIFNLRDSDSSVKSTGYDASVSTEWYLTDGSNTYSIGEISNPSALNNKTLKMAGHVHTYPAPTWVWDGYESATATFVCSDCGETVVETAAVTAEITKAPTESETGVTTYTATVTVNGREYTDTKTKTTHVGAHTFGTPQWDWNGYESATVTVTCTVDGDSFTADAAITSVVTIEPTLSSEGKRVHTATATIEGQTFTDTKEETLPKVSRDVSVSYRALNDRDVTVTARKLYGDETEETLTTGWYAVTDDLTIDFRPNCTGTVNLILCDGVTFNANKGINVADDATLTIWGQSEGTGTLEAVNTSNGACIGTSSGMNSAGNVSININGGTYLLSTNTSAPLIGCYKGSGVITVNKGTIRRTDYSTDLEVPMIGFIGYYETDGKTYTVNIRGGDIEVGKIKDSVAIGCESGQKCSVNITGGTISATLTDRGAVGIGAYMASECTVDISGGFINMTDDSGFVSNPTGIGQHMYGSVRCVINLSWRSLSGCSIYSYSYDGQINLYKTFKDDSDNILATGEHNERELNGKTLTPYCGHSYSEPAWTWNTGSEPFTASASFICSECGDHPTVEATVTKTRSLTEYIYTGSVTLKGETYTDECETRTTASMNLTVGGVRVTRDNAADILGDGKVSYDVTTNTLTLDNAQIPLAQHDSTSAYGIRYYDTADDPFHIVLIGENKITESQSLSSGTWAYFIYLDSNTRSYTFSGGGSLSFEMQSGSAGAYAGVMAYKPLTVDNAEINWEYTATTSIYFYGIMMDSGASLTLRNNAAVMFNFGYTGSGNTNATPLTFSGNSTSVIDVDETSSIALNSRSSAISGNFTLSDKTKLIGASVAENYRPGYVNYYTWDGTTALSTYNAIHIPDDISTHTITVVDAPNGSENIYPLQRKVGDTVEITASPYSGYGFAYMKVKRATDGTETIIYDKEFTMPACDVIVTPVFNPIIEYSEPYMTDDLDYVPGQVRHYEEDGKSYGVLDNGCMGAELSTPYWGYFTFQNINSESCRITRYTGSTDGLTELVIPKTYMGRKVTELGSGGWYDSVLGSNIPDLVLVLNENIIRINAFAFYYVRVVKVIGNTSSLCHFGDRSFLNSGGRPLDLQLDYPGSIRMESWSMLSRSLTVHMKHSATFSLNDPRWDRITYDFTDDHVYGDDPEPTWTWADDNLSATATFTCTNDRCKHQEVIDAAISGTADDEEHTLTATVTFNGKTFTDTKTLSGHIYGEPVWNWSADHTSASATFSCIGCDQQSTVDATSVSKAFTDDGVTYTATVTFDEKTYTGTITVSGGTEDNPFLIHNKSDWDLFAAAVNAGKAASSYYQLADDFDNADPITTPAGTSAHPFEGHFNGNSKALRVDISDTSAQGAAPFRYIKDAEIHDLTVSGSVVGGIHSAGLVGFNTGNGSSFITDVTVNMDVINSEIFGKGYIGGVLGHNGSATVNMTRVVFGGTLNNKNNYAGGLIGWSGMKSNMTDCLFKGSYIGSSQFHPVGIKSAGDTFSGSVERVYYTAEPNVSDSNYILTDDGILVFASIDSNTLYAFYRAADSRDYYRPASVSSLSEEYFISDGSEITPAITVKNYDGATLTEGEDYTVTYTPSPVKDTGEYTVTVTGKGGYSGSYTENFTVHKSQPYTITVVNTENGTISADRETAEVGDIVTLTQTPADELCRFEGWHVTAENGDEIAVDENNQFTMPASDVTVSATFSTQLGTEDYPFLIHNKADWNAFASKINSGKDTTAYYQLADDFYNADPITTTVGTSDHPFEGHFDGNGKTLNVNINDRNAQGNAPFRYIKDAEIHDLTVSGSVVGGIHSAGLVGFNTGNGSSFITDVTVNMDVINSETFGKGYIGGVLGHNGSATVNMTRVVFGGTLNNKNNYAGGLIGWSGMKSNMTDCLFKGSYIGSSQFHPVGIKSAGDTFSGSVERVYYTAEPNVSDSNYILTYDGVSVYPALGENQIGALVTAADGEDYYILVSISSLSEEYFISDGSEITPAITVKNYDGATLTEGEDYTVTYTPSPVKDTGEYTVTVTGKGGYSGSYTENFTVHKSQPYTITVVNTENGMISSDRATAEVDDIVTLTQTPDDELCSFEGWNVTDGSGNKIAVDENGQFTMPDSNVTVRATFSTLHGTEEYPFLIHNKADWVAFAQKINSGKNATAYYQLADDFDNSVAINVTVGTRAHPFEGHFDGNGKEAVFNISVANQEAMAPFSFVENADIHDLTVSGSVTGGIHSAGLVSHDYGVTTITNVTVNVNVTNPNTSGNLHIGGVIGHNETATLTMTNVVYSGTLNNKGSYVGGLIGWGGNSTINMTNCLFKGSYTGSGNFHPIGCMYQGDTFSGMIDRVYYTVDANFSSSNNILTDDGVKVFTTLGENQVASVVTAADNVDYYIPATVSGIESEYDYIITEITPEITVTAYDGTALERGTDYTVSYDPATVRTAGDYTVTVTGIGDFTGSYTASFTVTDHTYGEPEWEWSDDLSTATLVFTCKDDGYTNRINAPVSSKISKGIHVYTAFILLYGTPYIDTEVGSHIYGDPEWTWSDDCKTATATFTCTDARCAHTETVDATVTETVDGAAVTYTATAAINGTEYTDTKTVERQKYFVGHSLSLTGDIRMNYYLNLTDEQAQDAVVDFSWIVNGTEKTHSVTLTAEDKTAHGYIASVPVAVAEMTYDVTATLTVGGEQLASDTYSVRQYADVILSDSFASSYTGTGSKSYENLKTLIQTMLDYGAKAQVQFVRNTDNLANKGIDYTMSNVSADMITASPSNMKSGLDAYGLEYAGTTIVYLTKTSMRHYYKIVDQEKFDAVKDEITFDGEKVGYTERNGEIFFEHADIAAADLDTLYTLKIGDSEYQYSVLDYVRECLSSPNAPYATVQLVMATYWYNQAANAYFGR